MSKASYALNVDKQIAGSPIWYRFTMSCRSLVIEGADVTVQNNHQPSFGITLSLIWQRMHTYARGQKCKQILTNICEYLGDQR